MKSKLQAIIMAAGKSSRFKTNRSKLTEKICGQEMILYPTKIFDKLNIPTSVIVGYQKEKVIEIIKKHHGSKINFVEQLEQKGTAHALMCSKPVWDKENILIINSDTPLITSKTIEKLWHKHLETNSAASFVSAYNLDPSLNSYGKVIEENGEIKIVEAKDYAEMVKKDPSKKNDTCSVNAGIYIFKKDFLLDAITKIETSSVTGEFYITDLISIASKNKLGVEMLDAPIDQVRGINTVRELWIAEQIKKAEIINYWMDSGVRFQSAQNVSVEINVTIEPGTFIGQGAQLCGNTTIAENCTIKPFAIIENSVVEKNCTIESFSIVKDTTVKADSKIGPFANVNSSSIGSGTNVQSHSYLGSTTTGTDVQVGAGTIVCDHNGVKVDKTTFENNAFVGANNTVVSPVKIGEKAFTAAGSTVTKDVPANAMAIARSLQTNKADYATTISNKKETKKTTFTGAVKDTNFTETQV